MTLRVAGCDFGFVRSATVASRLHARLIQCRVSLKISDTCDGSREGISKPNKLARKQITDCGGWHRLSPVVEGCVRGARLSHLGQYWQYLYDVQ